MGEREGEQCTLCADIIPLVSPITWPELLTLGVCWRQASVTGSQQTADKPRTARWLKHGALLRALLPWYRLRAEVHSCYTTYACLLTTLQHLCVFKLQAGDSCLLKGHVYCGGICERLKVTCWLLLMSGGGVRGSSFHWSLMSHSFTSRHWSHNLCTFCDAVVCALCCSFVCTTHYTLLNETFREPHVFEV